MSRFIPRLLLIGCTLAQLSACATRTGSWGSYERGSSSPDTSQAWCGPYASSKHNLSQIKSKEAALVVKALDAQREGFVRCARLGPPEQPIVQGCVVAEFEARDGAAYPVRVLWNSTGVQAVAECVRDGFKRVNLQGRKPERYQQTYIFRRD